MALPNIFNKTISDGVIARIQQLSPDSTPIWGKMNVAQMLAHCCVAYEMTFENNHTKPNFFVKMMVKMFAKDQVVSEKPYPKNGRTGPQFIITGDRDFEKERIRLVQFIEKAQMLGESHFDNLESFSFGKLSKSEWSNLFYKHLDHHLTQFGV
jgi:hypothetical protein